MFVDDPTTEKSAAPSPELYKAQTLKKQPRRLWVLCAPEAQAVNPLQVAPKPRPDNPGTRDPGLGWRFWVLGPCNEASHYCIIADSQDSVVSPTYHTYSRECSPYKDSQNRFFLLEAFRISTRPTKGAKETRP